MAWANTSYGQTENAVLKGVISNKKGELLANTQVRAIGHDIVVFADKRGRYTMTVPSNETFVLLVSYTHKVVQRTVGPFEPGSTNTIDFSLSVEKIFEEVVVKRTAPKDVSVVTLDPKSTMRFPVTRIEHIVTKIGLGATQSGGELSSAYNVRGGNFNENLIYVNDIEVYRPFLVRSGQQEGLSFINPDMVDNLSFSAGGFSARYGDKLASVLDVKYKEPTEFNATVTAGLMNNGVHIEDQVGARFSYIIGARYRTTRLLLNSLDVAGSYQPKAVDLQSYLTYRINSNLSLSWLSTISDNDFLLRPESRETSFGTVQNAFKLFVAFDGAEQIKYTTYLNGVTLAYKPDSANIIKWITSYYHNFEQEHFTVEGGYRLDQLENNLGSDDFAESRNTLGIGYFIHHARNDLEAQVLNHKLMGKHLLPKGKLEWGVKYQQESIHDVLKEWDYNDSAEHNVTQTAHTESELVLDNVLNSTVELNSHRVMGYIEHSFLVSEKSDFKANVGIRSHYWSLNQENVISPRAQISFRPNKSFNYKLASDTNIGRQEYDSLKKRDWIIKAAAGVYHQPAFYRELRNIQGVINPDLKAQRALHFVLGGDMDFRAWDRPFRFIGEVYYKKMDRIVPYFMDDVRIRYSAQNSAEAYATGIDARINGEFIKNLESWINLSLLQTKENITYTDAQTGNEMQSGYIRRPTDQVFNFSVLFQDELPMDSTFKMHLNMVYASGLPYYFGGDLRYIENWTIPAYRRVDVGFSKVIFDENTKNKKRFKNMKSLWIGVEVFNLLQINNTISYIWVSDIQNNVYGIPNHLTGRRLNLRLIMRF